MNMASPQKNRPTPALPAILQARRRRPGRLITFRSQPHQVENRPANPDTTGVCGQADEYPQDRMCGTAALHTRRFFVQFCSHPEARFVQRVKTYVNP